MRLPAPAERDALSLLFAGADLFLAPRAEAGRGGVLWYAAWKNPAGFSAREVRAGAPRPPMDFLGWGLLLAREGDLAAVAFGPSGGFLGAAVSPRRPFDEPLRNLLRGLPGRSAREAAERLRVFGDFYASRPGGRIAREWEVLTRAFTEKGAAGPREAPPARVVPGVPGPGTLAKLFAVLVVIVFAGFANMMLARQRRRREAERSAEAARPRRRGF